MERLAEGEAKRLKHPREVVNAYRRRVAWMRGAKDERDLRALASLRFKRLKGEREHQHSLRLNDLWRVIVEIRPGTPKNSVHVVAIEDYH